VVGRGWRAAPTASGSRLSGSMASSAFSPLQGWQRFQAHSHSPRWSAEDGEEWVRDRRRDRLQNEEEAAREADAPSSDHKPNVRAMPAWEVATSQGPRRRSTASTSRLEQ
jgi:hypothetical protein